MISTDEILETGIFDKTDVGDSDHVTLFQLRGTGIYLLITSKYLFWLPNGIGGEDISFEELLETSSEEIQTKLLFNIELFSRET